MPWAALIPAAASLIGSVMGRDAASSQARAAERARQDALAGFSNIKVPTAEEMMATYQGPESVGEYTPEMLAEMQLGDTAYQSISTDPRLQQAQNDALAALQERGLEGMTLSEKAQLAQIQKQSGAQEQARQGAIMQEMAARGMGGAGSELAARLQSSQSAADRQSTQDMDVAAQAQERALQAIMQSGQLGGAMREQDFGEQAKIAAAKDLFKQQQFQHSTGVAQQNVGARNEAELKNLAAAQQIANAQRDTMNRQTDQRLGAKQQAYTNQMGRAAGMAGQYGGIANANQNAAAATASGVNQMAAGAGGLISAGISAFGKKDDTDVVKKMNSGSFDPNQA